MTNFEAPRVWLAPMSGATDAPFRRQAVRFGAPAVVSEMVAGESLAADREDVVRRICRHEGNSPWIVQLAGRRPEDMLQGARRVVAEGVDVIDINMGCPARKVTGGQSGSALMRDLDLATRIIEATLEGAAGTPVTLKMRLGWDDQMLNAPELAEIAQGLGVQMLTVHGRTRCQFYKGVADWERVRETVEHVSLPVIVNGDVHGPDTARAALSVSGAHGVMLGRAAMGRPWLVGQIAAALSGSAWTEPNPEEQLDSLLEQIDDSVDLYGAYLGVRTVRKHVSAAIDAIEQFKPEELRRQTRSRLCQIGCPEELKQALSIVYAEQFQREVA
ncbi:MAG: tRNA dihydrouridine synthase [Hyphomonas sp.]